MAQKETKPDIFEQETLAPVFEPASTPYERLIQVFRKGEFDIRSFELRAAWTAAQASFVMGLVIGGLRTSKVAHETWKKTHAHSVFMTHSDAARYMMSYLMKRYIIDGCRFGLRVGVVTGLMTLTTASLAARRNKAQITDLAIGGALAGAVYRIDVGPKAMLATGFLGGIFWQLLGLALLPVIHYSGYSLDDLYKEMRKDYYESTVARAKMRRELTEVAEEENVFTPSGLKMKWAERKLQEEQRLADLRARSKPIETEPVEPAKPPDKK